MVGGPERAQELRIPFHVLGGTPRARPASAVSRSQERYWPPDRHPPRPIPYVLEEYLDADAAVLRSGRAAQADSPMTPAGHFYRQRNLFRGSSRRRPVSERPSRT